MNTIKILFALSGMIMLISCGSGGDGEKKPEAPKPVVAEPVVDDMAAGEKVYRTYCIVCHGIDGKLELNGAKDLSISTIPIEERINQVTNGKGLMTPFQGILSEEQIRQVSEYTFTLAAEAQ
ncbi:MAG: cytochrome c [Saprospiraceae bacterium]|nr:cytochrome c [Saprospiraceae bacterium]